MGATTRRSATTYDASGYPALAGFFGVTSGPFNVPTIGYPDPSKGTYGIKY